MGLGSGRIPRLPHGTFRCVAGGVSLEPVPLGQGPHFGGHPGIFYPNTPMQINDPERTRQAAPELRLDAPGADDFTEHPLSMNGEAPAGKSVRNGKGAPAAPSFSCSTSCPLSHVPQKAWLHLFRVPFRKRHPVIFWGLLILLLGGIAAFMVSQATGLGSERIALVRVTGPIMDIDAQLRWIDKLGPMPGVKGVLVRVDSPGGGAAASQELYEALARLGKDKPIAVSMGSTAASGGLMVSMAGKRVFANASTVTGSVGVRMDIPQIRGLLDKLGMVWEKYDPWQERYDLALAYKTEHGDLEIPSVYKTADGVWLGSWVSRQRQALNSGSSALSSERRKLLRTLFKGERRPSDPAADHGTVREANWERNFRSAARYARKYKHLLVPASYVDSDGVRLGVWVSNLRAARKNRPDSYQVTPAHIKKLNSIGMVWDARDAKWGTAYQQAKAYYKAHGNLHAAANYKSDETGFCLGDWLRRMREWDTAHDPKLTPERRAMLDKIGMEWSE